MSTVRETSHKYSCSGKLKVLLLFHTPNTGADVRRIKKKYNLQKENKHQMNYGMILAQGEHNSHL